MVTPVSRLGDGGTGRSAQGLSCPVAEAEGEPRPPRAGRARKPLPRRPLRSEVLPAFLPAVLSADKSPGPMLSAGAGGRGRGTVC